MRLTWRVDPSAGLAPACWLDGSVLIDIPIRCNPLGTSPTRLKLGAHMHGTAGATTLRWHACDGWRAAASSHARSHQAARATQQRPPPVRRRAAAAAAAGEQESADPLSCVVGIDLGTTNSAVAVSGGSGRHAARLLKPRCCRGAACAAARMPSSPADLPVDGGCGGGGHALVVLS